MAGEVATSVFAGDPQPVEIHHRGIWYSGELLGWRHTEDGRVLARVRCVVDKLRHSGWKDLAELRLPDPSRPPRSEPFPAPLPRDERTAGRLEPDDETRPHVLLAALRGRPGKPAHAVTPPPPRRALPPHPSRTPEHRPAVAAPSADGAAGGRQRVRWRDEEYSTV